MRQQVLVAAALLALAVLDGMFAGFRSSCGRTGLVRHRHQDLVAHLRGLALAMVLLTPVAAIVLVDVVVRPARLSTYVAAGRVMLTVYLPYAWIVLTALAAYALLGWRRRFLASALILGPFTLARPLMALAGAAAAAWSAHDLLIAALCLAAAAAALAVEPLADRKWYAHLGPPTVDNQILKRPRHPMDQSIARTWSRPT